MMNTIRWLGGVAGLVWLTGGSAWACPDFSGDYLRTMENSHEQLHIEQIACETMNVRSIVTFDDGEEPHTIDDVWLLDGMPQTSPQYPAAMRITRQLEEDTLVTEGKMISENRFLHFISRSRLNAEGNISNTIAYYGPFGGVQRTETEVFVRRR